MRARRLSTAAAGCIGPSIVGTAGFVAQWYGQSAEVSVLRNHR
jgi:hypothetical protein